MSGPVVRASQVSLSRSTLRPCTIDAGTKISPNFLIICEDLCGLARNGITVHKQYKSVAEGRPIRHGGQSAFEENREYLRGTFTPLYTSMSWFICRCSQAMASEEPDMSEWMT